MNVRVRGIYSTALTDLFADLTVVQASAAIAQRFDREFPVAPADAVVETTSDRQGVSVVGDGAAVERVADLLADVGRDAFVWSDPAPRDAVFDGRVSETLGGGAVVDLGEREGYLPYGRTEDRIEEGDRLRVQIREGAPPWDSDRPVLDTDLELPGPLVDLVRGGTASRTGAADVVDLIPADPHDGWTARWGRAADDAEFEALDGALSAANERAADLEAALADAPAPEDRESPTTVWAGRATRWCWFGRESRFALDERRREVVPTMTGHHRIKAGDERASAAVDFVEAVCESADGEFPFDVVTRQFGPREGDRIGIRHGKPDGRAFSLGRGEVTERDPAGSVTVRRELSAGGTLDALGVPIEAGDVAVTKFKEGRWWYATTYRDADGGHKGTYVNVCTPLEVFPDAVRYVDLHVDVIKHRDGRVERVDDDELDAAADAGHLSADLAEKARSVAAAVEDAL